MRKKSEGSFLNIKMLNDTFFKSPDKIRQTIDVPGMQSATVYFNGRKAVRADSLDGNTVMENDALENLKMNVKMMNPAITWDKIFDKISVADELENVTAGNISQLRVHLLLIKNCIPGNFLLTLQVNL